jgi:linoleoyl-CoA desaturase
MSTITFNNQKNLFFRSLKEKVDNYFINNNISRSGEQKLYIKSILLITSAILLYGILVFFTPIWPISIVLCALLGINFAAIGFNIMHEGGHQSFSKYPWLNKASAYFLNVLGGNTYYWKIKHNINHHTYTNIEGLDSDINIKPFMRLHDGQPKLWIHRFQHVYFVIFYGLAYFSWVFYDDFVKYFSGKVAEGSVQKLSLKEHIIFWSTKIFYLSLYIVLPVLMVGFLHALIGFLISGLVCGFAIAVVFQLAHIVSETEFPTLDEGSTKIDQQWAVHQLNTTSNFATKSNFLSWMLGGLNFQVEHHLFPKISHIHYKKINMLVKETCLEFNVNYHEHKTMLGAIYSHLKYIKKMGKA